MKTNAVVRIIIYSIIILVLCTTLLGVIGMRMYGFRTDSRTEVISEYGINSTLFDADSFSDLEINWFSGHIEIAAADVDSIQVTESCEKSTYDPMVVKQKGSKLEINFSKEKSFSLLGNSTPSKDLTILIPTDWEGNSITVDVASAKLNASGLRLKAMEINTASGDCRFENCAVRSLALNGASGSLNYNGTLMELECSTVSGDAELFLLNEPEKLEMDGVSGNLTLTLPSDCGFRLERDSLSGKIECDYPLTDKSFGSGNCRIEMSGVSSSMRIHQGSHVCQPFGTQSDDLMHHNGHGHN